MVSVKWNLVGLAGQILREKFAVEKFRGAVQTPESIPSNIGPSLRGTTFPVCLVVEMLAFCLGQFITHR
jgi:hypothetical protein